MYTLIFELVLILKWNLDCNKVSISQKKLTYVNLYAVFNVC